MSKVKKKKSNGVQVVLVPGKSPAWIKKKGKTYYPASPSQHKKRGRYKLYYPKGDNTKPIAYKPDRSFCPKSS